MLKHNTNTILNITIYVPNCTDIITVHRLHVIYRIPTTMTGAAWTLVVAIISTVAKEVVSAQGECAQNWKSFGESCYLFVTPNNPNSHVEEDWEKARSYCLGQNADLVSLTTKEEVNFIYSHTKYLHYYFWIGLNRTVTPKDAPWVWSNGDKLTITQWAPNEPWGDHENCVEIWKFSKNWNNKECDAKHAWICEVPKCVSAKVPCRSKPTLELKSTTAKTTVRSSTEVQEKSAEMWEDFGNSCYLIVTPTGPNYDQLEDWKTARSYCLRKRADLVSLTTKEELDFVYSKTKDLDYYFWIGLKRAVAPKDAPWVWSNGDRLTITNWHPYEPFGDHENCVEILEKSKYWNNKECYEGRSWICEKTKSTGPCNGEPTTSVKQPTKAQRSDTNSNAVSVITILYIFFPLILLALLIVIFLLVRLNRASLGPRQENIRMTETGQRDNPIFTDNDRFNGDLHANAGGPYVIANQMYLQNQ